MADSTSMSAAAAAARPAYEWLQILGLGALLGALGQAARSIVGIKKLHDAASDSETPMKDMIEPMRLVVSFGIGGVAGALAAIPLVQDLAKVPVGQLFALASAGYAGSDFIEGFIRRISGSPSTPAGEGAVGVNTAASGASGAATDDAAG